MQTEDEKATDGNLTNLVEEFCHTLEGLIQRQNLLIEHLVKHKQALEAEFATKVSKNSSEETSNSIVIQFSDQPEGKRSTKAPGLR